LQFLGENQQVARDRQPVANVPGSTLVMRAINANCAKLVRKAPLASGQKGRVAFRGFSARDMVV